MKRILFIFFCMLILSFIGYQIFSPLYFQNSIMVDYGLHPFDLCQEQPELWYFLKIWFSITYLFSSFFFSKLLFHLLFSIVGLKFSFISQTKTRKKLPSYSFLIPSYPPSLQLLIGQNAKTNDPIYLPEKSLYQNILITGTIGTGKTSSSMYPFTKQLIEYQATHSSQKLGMLILDVKGNYHQKVLEFASNCNRLEDVIVIELNGKYKYNPLDKPNLKPSILANRLKTILLLFSQNNSESYWLDKASQILEESIKLCRLYHHNYVTFEELHKLITIPNYYLEKVEILRNKFIKNEFTASQVYDLFSSLTFFQKEFLSLDQRTLSILKSEITRITNCFISDYEVLKTFSPKKSEQNFLGFEEVLAKGKIVVLNMNIHEYTNLSKMIAAYLKLDFQTEVMARLSKQDPATFRSVCFISDEYAEYCTKTDAGFFAQSREAKCINIVATQSYTSLLNTLQNQPAVQVIIQNLINKLWFRSDDLMTIENAQKQIGKEEKKKTSQGFSENAKETIFNYFTNSFHSKNSNISETYSTYFQSDFIYDTNFFTQSLENFHCLGFLSDGLKILPPQEIILFPYFKN